MSKVKQTPAKVQNAGLFELAHSFQTAPIGLCVVDRSLRIVRINEWLAAISGKPVADHIGRTLREVAPEFAKKVEAIYQRVIASFFYTVARNASCFSFVAQYSSDLPELYTKKSTLATGASSCFTRSYASRLV